MFIVLFIYFYLYCTAKSQFSAVKKTDNFIFYSHEVTSFFPDMRESDHKCWQIVTNRSSFISVRWLFLISFSSNFQKMKKNLNFRCVRKCFCISLSNDTDLYGVRFYHPTPINNQTNTYTQKTFLFLIKYKMWKITLVSCNLNKTKGHFHFSEEFLFKKSVYHVNNRTKL